MATSVTEFVSGIGYTRAGSQGNFSAPVEPFVAQNSFSSAASSAAQSTFAMNGRTTLISILPIGAGFYALFTSSVSAVIGSSTTAEYFPAGVQQFRTVNPNARLVGWSS